MNHNWTIVKLITSDVVQHNNVVTAIDWLLTTSDDGIILTVGKIQPIEYINENFIEYNQLTEELVKQWLFDSMGERKQLFEQQMEININKNNTNQSQQLPWANN